MNWSPASSVSTMRPSASAEPRAAAIAAASRALPPKQPPGTCSSARQAAASRLIGSWRLCTSLLCRIVRRTGDWARSTAGAASAAAPAVSSRRRVRRMASSSTGGRDCSAAPQNRNDKLTEPYCAIGRWPSNSRVRKVWA